MTTSLTPNIQTIYGLLPFENKGHKYGLESEVESQVDVLPTINTEWWQSKPDTSLRYNGMEYVAAKPFTDANVEEQLKYLFSHLNKKRILHDSPRTSTHLHYNMMEHTPCQTWVAACAYWMVENILFKYCGEDREGNLFCLRLKDASGIMTTCIRDVAASVTDKAEAMNRPFITFRRNDAVRYGGLNLNSISKFGTLELRGMRGVYDVDTVLTWVKLVDRLFTNAVAKYKTPTQLVLDYNKRGAVPFVEDLFGDMSGVLSALCASKHWKELIDTNMNYLMPLLLIGKWSKMDESSTRLIEYYNKSGLLNNRHLALNEVAAAAGAVPVAVAAPRRVQVRGLFE